MRTISPLQLHDRLLTKKKMTQLVEASPHDSCYHILSAQSLLQLPGMKAEGGGTTWVSLTWEINVSERTHVPESSSSSSRKTFFFSVSFMLLLLEWPVLGTFSGDTTIAFFIEGVGEKREEVVTGAIQKYSTIESDVCMKDQSQPMNTLRRIVPGDNSFFGSYFSIPRSKLNNISTTLANRCLTVSITQTLPKIHQIIFFQKLQIPRQGLEY